MILFGGQIALPITILISKSIGEGRVPDEIKIAKLYLSISLKLPMNLLIIDQYEP